MIKKTNLQKINKTRGFTLIELMIVVAIIGILVSIAIPNFTKFICKAKQLEAKKNLITLRSCEEAYRAEYDTYGSNLDKIGFTFSGTSTYTYSFAINANPNTFTAHSKRNISGKEDEWTINQSGILSNTSNACL